MKIQHIQQQLAAYFSIITASYSRLPKNNRRALAIIVPIFIVALLIPVPDSAEQESNPRREVELKEQQIELSSQPTAQTEQTKPEPITTKWQRYQIQKGDSLIKIFRSIRIPDTDLYAVAAIEGKGKPVSRIHPGQWIQYKQLKDGSLDALLIEMDRGDPIMYFRLSSGDFMRNE